MNTFSLFFVSLFSSFRVCVLLSCHLVPIKSNPSLISNVPFEWKVTNILVLDVWVIFPSLCLLTVTFVFVLVCIVSLFTHLNINISILVQRKKTHSSKNLLTLSLMFSEMHCMSSVRLECSSVRFTTSFILLPGATARLCRGLPTPPLPSGQPTVASLQAATISTGRLGVSPFCLPAEPNRPTGHPWVRPPPHQPLHVRLGQSHPRGGGQAGQEANRHVWVPGLELPPVGRRSNCNYLRRRLLQTCAPHKTELRGLYRFMLSSLGWAGNSYPCSITQCTRFLAKETRCMSSISVSFTVGCLFAFSPFVLWHCKIAFKS